MTETVNIPKLMTIRQIAKTGMIPEHALRQLVKQGKVPFIQTGNRVLINFNQLVNQLNTM